MIDSFLELREGDLVVHVGHGIARYRGLKLLEKNGQRGRAPGTGVPRADEALCARRRRSAWCRSTWAARKSRPQLAKLSGRLWGRQKEKVEAAVSDMAAEMLELAGRPGLAARHQLSRWKPNGSTSSTPPFPTRRRPTN